MSSPQNATNSEQHQNFEPKEQPDPNTQALIVLIPSRHTLTVLTVAQVSYQVMLSMREKSCTGSALALDPVSSSLLPHRPCPPRRKKQTRLDRLSQTSENSRAVLRSYLAPLKICEGAVLAVRTQAPPLLPPQRPPRSRRPLFPPSLYLRLLEQELEQ
jgi:hypothetical protein